MSAFFPIKTKGHRCHGSQAYWRRNPNYRFSEARIDIVPSPGGKGPNGEVVIGEVEFVRGLFIFILIELSYFFKLHLLIILLTIVSLIILL